METSNNFGAPDVLAFEKVSVQTGLSDKTKPDEFIGLNKEEFSKRIKQMTSAEREELFPMEIFFAINYMYSKSLLFAKTMINGVSYIDIMAPFLCERAEYMGYIYQRNGFAYTLAEDIYYNLTTPREGERYVYPIDVTYVYDACLPLGVLVEECESMIIWKSFNHDFPSYDIGELPVFRFEKTQYEAALKQLYDIVGEQNELPSLEAFGKPVYTGGFKDGKRSGVGTLTWADGSNHKGTWENGRRKGLFVHTDAKGHSRNEVWDMDILVRLP